MAFCFIEWLKVLLSHPQMKECAVMSKFLIEGDKRLSDIGAALMVAALVAKGHSEITDIYHIDRGYENPLKVFREMGADIKRE